MCIGVQNVAFVAESILLVMLPVPLPEPEPVPDPTTLPVPVPVPEPVATTGATITGVGATTGAGFVPQVKPIELM